MTVHAAKGLEWETVFLCDLEETIFPSYKPVRVPKASSHREKIRNLFVGPPEEDLSEEKRLFYVGVTRARDHLFCITMRERDLYGRVMKMRESRFLKYLS